MKLAYQPLVLALTLLCAAGQSSAVGRLAEVSVYDRDSGQQLKTYTYRGQYYVVGTPGNRYAVSVRNNLGERMMAVISVDGVNVVNGETASPEQTGYVLNPHASTEINGWRKNMDEIAAFVFSRESNSYAARTGRPDDVGVIGVAMFREKKQPVYRRDRPVSPPSVTGERDGRPSSDAARAPAPAGAADSSRKAEADNERLGTAHGQRESSEVNYTNFVRASSRPDEVVSIRYDSYRNLVAQGVIRAPRNYRPEPNPFPGQFVPDPR